MKIALLTYFAADNYGAVLQTYATIKVLEGLGHHVQLVNYKIPEPHNPWIKKVFLYPKHLKLERFRRKHFVNLTKKYNSIEDLQLDPPQADCYLVGSDQTWNPELSKEATRGFYLDFGDETVLRASYAASFGVANWEGNKWINKEDAKNLLGRFKFISVREKSGQILLKNEFDISNARLVLDPVFLLNDYSILTGEIKQTNEIVLYKFLNSKVFYEKCKETGAIMSLPVRSIGSIRKIKGIHSSYPESLESWLRRIIGAKYLITDSFHGTVLALLYKKQFCVVPGKRITRIQSILDILNLSDRIVHETESVDKIVRCLNSSIDYNTVHNKILELRAFSVLYIKSLAVEGSD